MVTPRPDFVTTDLGSLRVRRAGAGRRVVLWHSLFIDSRSWKPLFERLSADREVLAIDGPSHGGSEKVHRRFTFSEVADAAAQAMDRLGCAEPVDWVGNAWGGHVGIKLAVSHPGRIRTLTSIGTPARGLSVRERWLMCWPLVQLYRVAGPHPLLVKALSNTLLGPETVAAQPERAADVMAAFAAAERHAMYFAMRSMMLDRPSMVDDVKRVAVPTLLIAARDDTMGGQISDANAVASTMPDARVAAVAGDGHVAPLLIDPDAVLAAITTFWRSVRER
jgi:pimeloyl-ACP methyl ester carboxylesterase